MKTSEAQYGGADFMRTRRGSFIYRGLKKTLKAFLNQGLSAYVYRFPVWYGNRFS